MTNYNANYKSSKNAFHIMVHLLGTSPTCTKTVLYRI